MRSQANQTPRYDILGDSFADLGDFVFFRSPRIPSKSAEEILSSAKKYCDAMQYDLGIQLG